MAELKLEAGKNYQIKTTEIQDGKKDVGAKHKYYILGADKSGNTFKAEFLCPNFGFASGEDRDQAVISEFPIGVMRWIKCWQVSPNLGTPTIEPAEEPGSVLKTAASLVGGLQNTSLGAGIKAESQIPYRPNCYSVNISGSSIAFSTSYAKDLLVAEIGQKLPNYEVTDEDVERMMRWAHVINDKICDRINFDK